jgi:transcriptional regulator with XRE-family HTH domain
MKRSDTNINVLLAQKGIDTDNQLASLMGLTPAALSNRLKGKLSLDTLERVADVLGVKRNTTNQNKDIP